MKILWLKIINIVTTMMNTITWIEIRYIEVTDRQETTKIIKITIITITITIIIISIVMRITKIEETTTKTTVQITKQLSIRCNNKDKDSNKFIEEVKEKIIIIKRNIKIIKEKLFSRRRKEK